MVERYSRREYSFTGTEAGTDARSARTGAGIATKIKASIETRAGMTTVISRKPNIVSKLPVTTDADVIYVDHSILSTVALCNEKGRLAYVEHHKANKPALALDFGSCFHAATQAYYDSIASLDPAIKDAAIKLAEIGFIEEWKARGGNLPIQMDNDSDEKRSLERGIWLVKAYITRWKNESYVNVINQSTGKPYNEIGFAVYLMDWHRNGKTIPVMYVGRWDRIMRSRLDNNLYIIEVKTTTQGLSYFVVQVKPNHSLTGYMYAARELFDLQVAGVVWDCAFVSSRQPNLKTSDLWLQVGIDIEKDFARTETRRSPLDIDEWLYDTRMITKRFLELQDQHLERWHRNAPTACHMYGGCQFKDVCSFNLSEQILKTNFHKEEWKPWHGITE